MNFTISVAEWNLRVHVVDVSLQHIHCHLFTGWCPVTQFRAIVIVKQLDFPLCECSLTDVQSLVILNHLGKVGDIDLLP